MATVRERNGAYQIRVSAGYDSEGRQIIRSFTWTPELRMTTKQKKDALDRKIIECEKLVNDGGVNVTNIKVCDFTKQYLETKRSKLSPTTFVQYERVINTVINPALGHMKLKDVRPLHVQNFLSQLENTPSQKDSGHISASTVQRYFVVLKSIFALAYKLQLTDVNPTDTRRLEIPKIEEPKTDIFTEEETQQLFSLLDSEPLMWKLLIHMAVNTGCRRGELVALRWRDIDYKKQTVTVEASAYKVKGEEIKNKSTKNGKTRVVSVPVYLLQMCKEYQREQRLQRLQLGSAWQGSDFIFTQADGSEMYPSTPSLWFDRFQKRNGLNHHKFHALRHTAATLLLAAGTDIKTVGQRLGHSQLTTTNRYVHALESADKAAAQTLENMFDVKKQA